MSRRRAIGIVVGTALLTGPVLAGVATASSMPVRAAASPAEVSGAGSVGTPLRPQPALPVKRLIVRYRTGAQRLASETVPGSSRVSAARLVADRPIAAGLTAVTLASPTDVAGARVAARQLATDPRVVFAEPDLPVQADSDASAPGVRPTSVSAPNDPLLGGQWPLVGPDGIAESGPSGAWAKSGGAGVVVAVLDTGITSHPDFSGQTVAGYDMISDPTVSNDGDGRDANPADPGDWTAEEQSSWHGTHVSGTIAARTDNGVGVAGVAPLAKVQPVRVLGTGGGYDSDVEAGIYWAAGYPVSGVPTNPTPARVINMSLGGYAPDGCPASEQAAINAATAAGVTVVVAAGNDGGLADVDAPANCANVVTVAATDSGGYSPSWSNYGGKITLAAPGVNVLSTINSGVTSPATPAYASYSGTSMATPHVSGAVAQLLSLQPSLTPAQVAARLRSTARVVPECPAIYCGAGILNAAALVGVSDPIAQKRSDPAMAFLGNAVGARQAYAGGGQGQAYQYGWIYYTAATGAHQVGGAILTRYQQYGGPTGFLGFPATDETSTPNRAGRYNYFPQAGGAVYWTPATGAHLVYGAIRATWVGTGSEAGPLGFPTTDEMGTPDGIGRYNHFSKNGSVYWTSRTGAQAIYGAIRAKWAALGWERGRLGYPISSEYGVAGGRRNDFQHGSITWTAAGNFVTVTYR
jgi:serine protease